MLRDEVAVVELNHLYNEKGEYLHSQIVWWDWHENIVIPATEETVDECTCEPVPGRPEWRGSRYLVVDWRTVRVSRRIIPYRDWDNGGYTSFWWDGGILRRIHAGSFRETWTLKIDDPEKLDNLAWPERQRRFLSRPKVEPKPFVKETPSEGT